MHSLTTKFFRFLGEDIINVHCPAVLLPYFWHWFQFCLLPFLPRDLHFVSCCIILQLQTMYPLICDYLDAVLNHNNELYKRGRTWYFLHVMNKPIHNTHNSYVSDWHILGRLRITYIILSLWLSNHSALKMLIQHETILIPNQKIFFLRLPAMPSGLSSFLFIQ